MNPVHIAGISLLLPAAVTAMVYAAPASAAAPDKAASATQATEPHSVPAGLMRLDFLQGKPDLDAKYYIYVQSASWCGPCRMYMPVIVRSYEQLKEAGVEIILVGRDSNEQATLKYAQGHNVPFPVLQGSPALEGVLPGFERARGIPHIQIVAKDGTVKLNGHPQHFFKDAKWKEVMQEWKDNPSASDNPDKDDENGQYDVVIRNMDDMDDMLHTVGHHLRSEQKFQSRTPNPGAMVMSTPVSNDIMAGFGLREKDGVYTLVPAYLDSWRMLHAYKRSKTQKVTASGSNLHGGWGNQLTQQELQAVVKLKARLDKILRPGMSDSEKVLAIHDDLVNRATYIKDAESHTTGMIFGDKGGCEGYTRYMFLALNMADIPCHRIVGTDGFNHSWNLVKIDNRWYHLDAAWDDPAAKADGKSKAVLSHAYCCVSDAVMAKDHKWDRSIYPEAKADYPFAYRRTISSPQDLKSAMKQAYRCGASTFEAKLTFKDYSVLKDSGCPVEYYAVTDPEEGSIVVYFDRTESGAAPIELKVTPKPVDSPQAAARWKNIRLDK